MTRFPRPHHNDRLGFTMVELLVVIGIVLLLMSLSVVVLNSAIGLARQRATQATILKVHGLMQQRVEAFNRSMDRLNLQPAINKMKRDLGISNTTVPQVYEILARKQIYQLRFPQSFSEAAYIPPTYYFQPNIAASIPNYVSASHNINTESAALLYWILTKAEVYGVAPVDESEFSSSEARDTDGDGLLEFVDGWGQPLRFYRWPTQLFRPGNASTAPGVPSTVDRTYVSTIWSGLPALPTTSGVLDPLARDPDDPTGALRRFAIQYPAVMPLIQNFFHTPDTYHAFLIMSAGADKKLGIGEPYEITAGSGSASIPTISNPSITASPGQGRLAALLSYNTQDNAIYDNITNRKR